MANGRRLTEKTLFLALSDYLKADNYFSYNVMIDLTPLSLRYWQSIQVQ